jgi:hypothetical protein
MEITREVTKSGLVTDIHSPSALVSLIDIKNTNATVENK